MAAKSSCVLLRGILGRNVVVFSRFQCKIGGTSSLKWRHVEFGRHLHSTISSLQLPKELATEHRTLILSAVCVQRLPRITPDKTALVRRFEDLQNQLELEHSVLSEDELEAARLVQRKKRLKEEDEDESMDIAKQQAQRMEFEEAEEEALKVFSAGGRVTEADRENDLKSVNRKLQENLVLLVRKEPEQCWEMPCGEISDSETLKEAAQRSLSEDCGKSLVVQFFSNAPNALYKKPKKNVKVFFYKAQYNTGDVELSGKYTDHVWITKEEMEHYVAPDYYKAVSRFIF